MKSTKALSASRLKAIELLYKDCVPGTMGHSLVALALEVKRLRAKRRSKARKAAGRRKLLPSITISAQEFRDNPSRAYVLAEKVKCVVVNDSSGEPRLIISRE